MIQKLLNEIIVEEDRKKREDTLRLGITGWRSSGLGTCMRGRFLGRLLSGSGIKPEYDPRTLRVFEIGNQVEEWLMISLKKQKKYRILQQIEMYDPELNLSGHLDAMLWEEGSTNPPYIVECKSKNSKAFWYMDKKGEGAQMHHKMQLHSYLYMLNKYGGKYFTESIATLSPVKVPEGCLLYVSKDDMAMLEYPVKLEDKTLEKMWKYEIETLNTCWKAKTAPPAPEKGSWQEKYCKFCEAGICGNLDDAMVKDLFEENPEIVTTSTMAGTSTITVKSSDTPPSFKVGDRVLLSDKSPFIGTPSFPVKGSSHESVGSIVEVIAKDWYGIKWDKEESLGKFSGGHLDYAKGWF